MQFYNGGSHHTRHSDTTIVPTHIHQIHKSLIHHNIITHPRVINCSSFYWKQEKDLPFPDRHKLINRCGNVHLCPICSYLQDRKIFARVKPMSNLLQQHDGDVHLITLTLRHNRSHTLQQLSEVLNKSVKEIKTSYPFKKFYGSKDRLFSLSKYEVSWSEDYGYHPHCHIQIGTTNPTPMKLIESELKSKWIEIVTKHAPDRTMIPSEEFFVVIWYPIHPLNTHWTRLTISLEGRSQLTKKDYRKLLLTIFNLLSMNLHSLLNPLCFNEFSQC